MIQAECELHAGRRDAAIAVLAPLLAAMDPVKSPVDTERVRALFASAQGRAYTSQDTKRNP